METRVSLLEKSTRDLRYEVREMKSMIRDLATEMREGFRAISAKFDTTDKAIADLRVDIQSVRTEFKSDIQSVRTEIQSVRTEIQSVRTEVERGLRENLSKTVAWFGLMFTIAAAVVTILVKLPHF
jgi:predicted  nucleic acid-binding Zn-ribbon protein